MFRNGSRRNAATMRRPSGVVAGSEAAPDAPDVIFGASLEGWWRMDAVTTTGSSIDQVDDLSGNARHMVQTGSNRPTTTTLLGQDAARFDIASTQWLETGGSHSLGSAPWAICFVGQCVTQGGFRRIVSIDDLLIELRDNGTQMQGRVGSTSLDGTTASTTAAAYLLEDAGGTASLYVDNASEDSASATHNMGTARNWALGARRTGANPSDVTMCEALVISGAITAGQRAQLQAYFGARYGL